MQSIVTRHLSKNIGTARILDNINLHVPTKSIYGFLGPNGAGKTTTIRLLLGLTHPSEGEISLFGEPLKGDYRSLLRRVGSLVEGPALYGHLNAIENLRIAACIYNTDEARILETLDTVGLTDAAHQIVETYSLGMKQRLGLALALLHEPELLILDEPTNGLDPVGIREFRELLIRLRTDYDITILLSSHLLAEIEQMATHVGVINDGKLLFEGTLEQLKRTQPTELTLRVDATDKAMTVLRQIGVAGKRIDATILCNVQDDVHAAQVVAALVRHGIQVYECHRTNGSLESIFIGLTEPEVERGNS